MTEKIEKLINEKNYKELKNELLKMNEYDIASIIGDLPEDEFLKVFRLLSKDMAAEVFSYIETDIQVKLITTLTNQEAVNIITNMYSDDVADLFEEIPAGVVARLLKNTDKDFRANINLLLNYPENSAGSIMTTELIDLKEDITVKSALDKIRIEANRKEAFDTCYVTNKERKLIGIVLLKDIVLSEENSKIKDIMDDNIISTHTLTDQEEVSKIFQNYDITSLPVTDSEDRLVGIITIDDIMDIVTQEATEDIEKMAAIVPTEKPYLKLSIIEICKSRIPWLLLLMISATFTGKIIQNYEEALASYVALISFIPMLMNSGGNAGGQASVTVIRGISLNEIEFTDWLKVIWKEFRVSIIVGLTLAIANFLKLIVFDKMDITVSLIVCLTLVFTTIISKIVGSSLPIIAKKIGLDPTVMASPFVSTIVDAITLITYFNIAGILLNI